MSASICRGGHYAGAVLTLLVAGALQAAAQTGVYTLSGGTASQTGQAYAATLTDQSAVYVLSSGHLTLTNCTMTKSGDSSNPGSSSQYGLNAGVLATTASTITIVGGSVTTNAIGANGLFARNTGTAITMSNGTITTGGNLAHGVDVTYGGSITLNNVNVTSTGPSSSALATDFGGGTVTVTGGTIIASNATPGSHSAGIYSTGNITVHDATVTSLGDCGGVIDGANSITLTNTHLTGVVEGIKIWKTAPASGTATVSVSGGSLTATAGDGFYVTGETGNPATASLTLSNGASVSAGTGAIVHVISASTASLTANAVALNGNLVADSTSTLTANLQNGTSLTGTATRTGMTVGAGSTWLGMAGSTLTGLSNAGAVGSPAGAPGAATISGSYSQTSTGTLEIQLGGPSAYDHLAVSGAATLNGTLNVVLINGFVPTIGQTFNIITRGSGSGAFSSLISESGLTYSVAYSPTLVQITVVALPQTGACCLTGGSCSVMTDAACAGDWQGADTACEPNPCLQVGDLNCDGLVNAFDIDPFVLALTSAPNFAAYYAVYPGCDAALADVNCDGGVNAFDIDPFVLCLTAGGCPACP